MLNNITTIIPIISLATEKEQQYLLKALESIKNQRDGLYPKNVLIVCGKDIDTTKEKIINILYSINKETKTDFFRVCVLENPSETPTISNQINFAVDSIGVNAITTDYFTYLEFDDEFTPIYFNNVQKYLTENNDISVLLPLSVDRDEEGRVLKYNNEISFSRELNDVVGELSHSGLLKVPYFSLSGAVFKKSDFVDIGKLKNNIKYTFFYEYLLRATDQCQRLVVMPKIGYIHTVNRENSYNDIISKDTSLTQEEMGWWYETAKKEFYFRNIDRKLTYKPKLTPVLEG
jgi:hypothetical protein